MMLFTLVRVGIAAALFAICAYLIRRLKAKNRRILLIVAGIVAMIVCLFLHQIPLENACVSFHSP